MLRDIINGEVVKLKITRDITKLVLIKLESIVFKKKKKKKERERERIPNVL